MEPATLEFVRANLHQLVVPTSSHKVYKNECAFSFATPRSETGLFINLRTFTALGQDYLDLDYQRTKQSIYLHQKWTRIAKPKQTEAEKKKTDQTAPTKMAIGVEGGFQTEDSEWETQEDYQLVLMPKGTKVAFPHSELPDKVKLVVDAIIAREDAAKLTEFTGWEEKCKESKYAKGLIQLDNGKTISPNPKDWKCETTGATTNLWLNLSDGHIGDGRGFSSKLGGVEGGSGAALKHYEATGGLYPLVVKLGTITPKGADVFSYSPDENDMVLDPFLADHLAHWGIDILKQSKTDKTIQEMDIDINTRHEFDTIQEEGKELDKLHGPGLVGLRNTGNSCYVNSLLQVLFHLPEFEESYLKPAESLFTSAPSNPVSDFGTQMSKLAMGLLTNKYEHKEKKEEKEGKAAEEPTEQQPSTPPQYHEEVTPKMIRAIVGRGHPDFSTGKQQDAHEYYQHFLTFIERSERARGPSGPSLSEMFAFDWEERLECSVSNNVRYTTTSGANTLYLEVPIEAGTKQEAPEAKDNAMDAGPEAEAENKKGEATPAKKAKTEAKNKDEKPVDVPFSACLSSFAQPTQLSDFMSSATGKRGPASKITRFGSFPRYLMLQVKRYVPGPDWVPMKLNALIKVPEKLDLEHLRGLGLQPSETELPERAATAETALEPDTTLLAQLVTMGFSENGCKKACIATKNANAEVAMNWVFQHMEDPGFNDPPVAQAAAPKAKGAAQTYDPEVVMMVSSMGFTEKQVVKALSETSGDGNRAAEWLFSRMDRLDQIMADDEVKEKKKNAPKEKQSSQYELVGFISHMGKRTSSGHYVCHLRVGNDWVIFNDRKVCRSQYPPLDRGYLYLFRRIDKK